MSLQIGPGHALGPPAAGTWHQPQKNGIGAEHDAMKFLRSAGGERPITRQDLATPATDNRRRP